LTYKGRTKRLFLFALFSPLAPLLYIWTVTYVSGAGMTAARTHRAVLHHTLQHHVALHHTAMCSLATVCPCDIVA
jgi:hypothetical protein